MAPVLALTVNLLLPVPESEYTSASLPLLSIEETDATAVPMALDSVNGVFCKAVTKLSNDTSVTEMASMVEAVLVPSEAFTVML